MKNISYNDYWHNQTSECVAQCEDEKTFISKVGSCAVCVGQFVKTAFKAIFKV
jgi:hypothetical protein